MVLDQRSKRAVTRRLQHLKNRRIKAVVTGNSPTEPGVALPSLSADNYDNYLAEQISNLERTVVRWQTEYEASEKRCVALKTASEEETARFRVEYPKNATRPLSLKAALVDRSRRRAKSLKNKILSLSGWIQDLRHVQELNREEFISEGLDGLL